MSDNTIEESRFEQLVVPKVVETFRGPWACLSNFYPGTMLVLGDFYPTVEHAYQAFKTLDPDQRAMIRALDGPQRAKKKGKRLELRPDWEDVKVAIMKFLLLIKFNTHENYRIILLSTGNAELQEGNNWGDTFWGICNGTGENILGKLLVEVRDYIRILS